MRASAGGDFPVWVGGRAAQVRQIVAVADGWNSWGTEPDQFSVQAALVREIAPEATLTWGGLARPLEEGAESLADALAAVRRGGRRLDHRRAPSTRANPANAPVLGDVRARLNA